MMLGHAGHRASWISQSPELHLAFQLPVHRGIFQIHHLAQGVVGVLQGHESAHELGEGPRDGDVDW